MSYRTRVDAAILTGTPPLRAMLWALAVRRSGRSSFPHVASEPARAPVERLQSRSLS